MGAVFIASLAPSLLFMLFGGVAADRLPRRAIMLWSDTGRAVVVAVIAALALLHILQFWHLLTLSLLFGLADSFFQPAYMAVVPQLVDERVLLQPANSLIQFGNVISRVIGPPLGALFVASWTGVAGAFGLDAFSFLFSAGCLSCCCDSPTPRHHHKRHLARLPGHREESLQISVRGCASSRGSPGSGDPEPLRRCPTSPTVCRL